MYGEKRNFILWEKKSKFFVWWRVLVGGPSPQKMKGKGKMELGEGEGPKIMK